jgi:hypothetical protein
MMEPVAKPSKYAVRLWLVQRRASGLPLPELADIARALHMLEPAPANEGRAVSSGQLRHA